ncbi:AcrR family transcriptional regulator [Kineococcus xinjiangensis]|uniref:AcrR family transcriptional regulator n=1 Tax=Kineococcus xinjiangensis TaxID=512762 RepID=A0A2S6IT90_9ACTN|nr:TetR/AcrR family transcriptional regulator C-terminal domain-containing protein [Kineococcus xinjiangensis]PPK97448.1 AcrR family transcriptional regulator [Kineococcus xinjiangensis]
MDDVLTGSGTRAAPPRPTTAVSPRQLSPERVVQAAVEFVDKHGLAELSMRRLGAYLGVDPMALYRHVAGRDALLDAVVEVVVEDVLDTMRRETADSSSWQDYLHRLAFAVRGAALEHPQVFPLVATRPPAAPWLRPPLRSVRWVELFLSTLRRAGFTGRQAVAAYRAFTSFLLGHLLLEVSALGVDTGPEPELEPDGDTEDLDDFPTVRGLQPELTEDHSAAEFQRALDDLLARVEEMRLGEDPAV